MYSVLKSALEQTIREDELSGSVKTTTLGPGAASQSLPPRSLQFLDIATSAGLHVLYEIALRTGLGKENS
ncbi:hypothetical protein ACFXKW_27440 [Streptomyces sp. NPDC059193]|uniref:hypothetical protein n=1 Tax=Streptomyces sp. NPDC059193 TaxID=3346763 RepID=UPI003682ECDC